MITMDHSLIPYQAPVSIYFKISLGDLEGLGRLYHVKYQLLSACLSSGHKKPSPALFVRSQLPARFLVLQVRGSRTGQQHPAGPDVALVHTLDPQHHHPLAEGRGRATGTGTGEAEKGGLKSGGELQNHAIYPMISMFLGFCFVKTGDWVSINGVPNHPNFLGESFHEASRGKFMTGQRPWIVAWLVNFPHGRNPDRPK